MGEGAQYDYRLGLVSRSATHVPPTSGTAHKEHVHRETKGLEGGVSSLGDEGRNYGGGVVKIFGVMKFQ